MNRFYFDHNATTPVAPEALDAYMRAAREAFGNASSIHQAGQHARREFDRARTKVAALFGAGTKDLVFCSGGTEADNLALFGAVRHLERSHLITTAIEHPAVLQCAEQLRREGHEISVVRCGSDGVIDPDDVRREIRPNTALISAMHVNNETGTIQPVTEIARIARDHKILMHSDGVQAAGRIPVDIPSLGIDLYSVSGHKMYAPKGVGVLLVRKGAQIQPAFFGGRHENGRRAGTENVPGAVSLGVAADLAGTRLNTDMAHVNQLRDRLETGLLEAVPDIRINCARSPRVPGTSSICIGGIEGEAIVIALDLKGFCVSSGSACSSGATEPSHVLTAIGLSRREAKSCIRISAGRSNTAAQVDALVDAIADVSLRLRRISTEYAAHA